MNPVTKAFQWVEVRLDVGCWFRRIYVIVATILTWQVVYWSFMFARYAAELKSDLIGVAAVIAAINASVGLVQGFAFKQYIDARNS